MSSAGCPPDRGALHAAAEVLGALAEADAPLGARTTYRVGGPAALLATVSTVEDLGRVALAHQASGLPVLVVGRGSNLLVADAGFPGIAVVLDPASPHFSGVHIAGTQVTAGAAVPLPSLARRCVEAGLTGFEWAMGVPGSIGGAVRMNAGGHGSDMAACLVAATVVDLTAPPGSPGAGSRRIEVGELAYGYRHSALASSDVVIDAVLGLAPGSPESGAEVLREIVRWRRAHQPGGQNAGSVFTNPAGHPGGWTAGWLIEESGWKGERRGSAAVSPKHANFIQADAGGSADDVDALIRMVQRGVAARFGVELTTEIRRVGFPPEGSEESQPGVER